MKDQDYRWVEKAVLRTEQAGMKQLLERRIQHSIASLSKKEKRKG